MSKSEICPPVGLIAGPTASGKTALALTLAAGRKCVVINADSAQVYAGLPVLSAQPTAAERQQAPHRLFGFLDAGDACSAARWAAAARAEIDAAHAEGALPLLVGGTGLYLRTLLDGIAPIPDIPPEIREEVRRMPVATAHEALRAEDAVMASRLPAADTARVQRALEVVRATGRSIDDWRRARTGGIGGRVRLGALVLLPPRGWLLDRCDRRFAAMLEQGAVDEVDALLARGLPPGLPAMRAIGVREIAAWRAGDTDRAAALAAGQQATRNYAKRQYTWFRNQSPPDWHRLTTAVDSPQLGREAIKLLTEGLT